MGSAVITSIVRLMIVKIKKGHSQNGVVRVLDIKY